MVSVTLFGKKWDFEIDTFKYFGIGLAILYMLRIIKYFMQKYLTGKEKTPIASDASNNENTAQKVDSKEADVSKETDEFLPSEKDKKTN